jgi:hypothetical protein
MTIRSLIALICTAFVAHTQAEVTELSNTEMTEAYIKDGAIVIKQRPIETAPTPKQKVNIKVGAGEPAVSEASQTGQLESSNNTQQALILQEYNTRNTAQQYENFEFEDSLSGLTIQDYQSTAQVQRDLHAQNLVRQGLGLSDDTAITQDMLVQYLQTFAGQSSGDVLGAHQAVTNDGFQIIIPNPGGQFENGVFPSGDQSMNVETTNQQIIFNLLFPKQ